MSKIVILALLLVAVAATSPERNGFFGIGAGLHGSVGGVEAGAGFEEGVDSNGNYHKSVSGGIGPLQPGNTDYHNTGY